MFDNYFVLFLSFPFLSFNCELYTDHKGIIDKKTNGEQDAVGGAPSP